MNLYVYKDGEDPSSKVTFSKGGCWRSRSKLEKCLIIAVVIFTLILVGVIIALIIVAVRLQRIQTYIDGSMTDDCIREDVCMTDDRLNEGTRVARLMDESTAPCDDFYQFACGGFIRDTTIPEDKKEVHNFRTLTDKIIAVLSETLEKTNLSEIDAIRKSKILYRSCMNTTIVNSLGDTPAREFLSQFSGWPIIEDSWQESNFSLENSLLALRKAGYAPVIYLKVDVDLMNSTRRLLFLDQPTFGITGRGYYLRNRTDATLMAYEKLIKDVAIAMGANPGTAATDAGAIVDFEIRLAKISVPSENRTNYSALYNPLSLQQLSENYSQFDWTGYITSLMSWAGVDVSPSETIILYSIPYYNQLFPVLTQTQNRTIANYLLWFALKPNLQRLNDTFARLLLDYNRVLLGIAEEAPRYQQCANDVNDGLGLAAGRLFVEAAFDRESKRAVEDMAERLQQTLVRYLDQLDWMDESTKTFAKRKAELMEKKVGYPDQIFDDAYLNKLYANMTFSEDSYFVNHERVNEVTSWTMLNKLRQPRNRSQWDNKPAEVNAYYTFDANLIIMLAGILQLPFYKTGNPLAMNYGGIGFIVGHEITHGFDNLGRQYDEFGNLKMWWTTDSLNRFNTKTECMISQYSSYTVKEAGMNVNGLFTLSENIADNGGLKQSYLAYKDLLAENPYLKLPRLNYTSDQLFFIQYAQNWCNVIRPETAVQRIVIDYHAPMRYRVIGPLHNFPEFASAFSCPTGSYMNPEKKCAVW